MGRALHKGEIVRIGDSESPEFFRVQSLTPKKVVLKRLGRREAESAAQRQGLREKRPPQPSEGGPQPPEPLPTTPGTCGDPITSPTGPGWGKGGGRLILTPEEALREAREIERELDASDGYGREF